MHQEKLNGAQCKQVFSEPHKVVFPNFTYSSQIGLIVDFRKTFPFRFESRDRSTGKGYNGWHNSLLFRRSFWCEQQMSFFRLIESERIRFWSEDLRLWCGKKTLPKQTKMKMVKEFQEYWILLRIISAFQQSNRMLDQESHVSNHWWFGVHLGARNVRHLELPLHVFSGTLWRWRWVKAVICTDPFRLKWTFHPSRLENHQNYYRLQWHQVFRSSPKDSHDNSLVRPLVHLKRSNLYFIAMKENESFCTPLLKDMFVNIKIFIFEKWIKKGIIIGP